MPPELNDADTRRRAELLACGMALLLAGMVLTIVLESGAVTRVIGVALLLAAAALLGAVIRLDRDRTRRD